MKKEKDLQKKIQKEFEKPDMAFEDWAKKHNIDLQNEQFASQSTNAIISESPSGPARSSVSVKKRIGIGVIVAFAALAVALPILFVNLSYKPAPLKLYGANDVNTVTTTVEEMLAVENIYYFNSSIIFQSGLTTKDVLIENETKVLSYAMSNCLVSFEYDGIKCGFYITYKVRLYENYEFLNYNKYYYLNDTTKQHDININYKLVEDLYSEAYARFKIGHYDYFLYAKGVEGITTLTNDNFLILLDELL